MIPKTLRGVIAASITPLDEDGAPDHARLLAHVGWLLDNGCDGINLLGTTGEATSFTRAQREAVMQAVAASDLPINRFMVGTGAAAVGDAVELTKLAGKLGFAGALVLPPFYYKPVTDAGVVAFFGNLVEATGASGIPLYLYNFPALTGIAYTPALVAALVEAFGVRIAGLKDSSGDLAYAREIAAISPDLSVFPSNEAVLLDARSGAFAGCISATANVNSRLCGAAFRDGDAVALAKASAIRAIFNDLPLVPSVKALVSYIRQDDTLRHVVPPLMSATNVHFDLIRQRYAAV